MVKQEQKRYVAKIHIRLHYCVLWTVQYSFCNTVPLWSKFTNTRQRIIKWEHAGPSRVSYYPRVSREYAYYTTILQLLGSSIQKDYVLQLKTQNFH